MAKSVLATKPVVPGLATNTVLGSTQNPAVAGGTITFYATVAPAVASNTPPTGNVTFSLDGVPQTAIALVDGRAAWSTSAITAGNRAVVATYNQDSTYLGSTSITLSQVVNSVFATGWHPTGPGIANAPMIAKWFSDVTSNTMWGVGKLVPDGVTDNSPLLAAMMRSVGNTPQSHGGECFYFPPGDYAFLTMVAGLGTTGTSGLPGAPGTGYAVGQTLTPVGGTGTPATYTVATINAGGGVTSVTLADSGAYTVAPNTSNTPTAVTGGTGSGCTISTTYACINGTVLSSYHFTGALGSDGNPASHLFTTLSNAILCYAQSNTATFQHSKLIWDANATGTIGVYIDSVVGPRIDKCDFKGYTGIFCSRIGGSFAGCCRDCRFLGTAGFSHYGFACSGPTCLEVNNCLFDSWLIGLTMDGTGAPIKDSTFNFCGTGLAIGVTNTGGSASASRAYFENLLLTNNDTAMYWQNSALLVYHNIRIVGGGAGQTPNGTGSVYAINVNNVNGTTADGITTTGPFSDSAVIIFASANTTWYNCAVDNSLFVPNSPTPLDPHTPTNSPAKWKVSSAMTGLPFGDRTNFVFGSISNTSLRASVAQPVIVCDETARRVTVGPESTIVDMTTVGIVGNNNAGTATSNTTAWRAFITAHAGTSVIMYFPQGKYLFNGQIDLSPLLAWEIWGDGTDTGSGQNGTRIQFTGTPANPCLSADYSGTGGCGQFHIRDINLSSNQATGSFTTFFARNVAMSSIKNSQIVGNIGFDVRNAFKCTFTTTELVSNLIGIYAESCYACTFENPDNNSGTAGSVGYQIAGGKNNAFFSARVETVTYGFIIGQDISGNPMSTANLSMCGVSQEACDFGQVLVAATNFYGGAIGIHCTTNSPGGHSRVAYYLQAVTGGTFLSCTNDGSLSNTSGQPFDGWAWFTVSPADQILFNNCTGSNTSPTAGGTYSNTSTGVVTQLACSFPFP